MLFRKITLAVPLCAIALAVAPCAFAQMSSPAAEASPVEASPDQPSASESMHHAGESAENAMEHAYNGTRTAVKDTTITARVKSAIHHDKDIRGSEIHVDTVAGVVTLSGSAPTTDDATRATEVAQRTKGVRSVKDAISIAASNSSMR
jgi:hyperosmotically inducible periplasmic protein